MTRKYQGFGFTLIEILVVVSIIAILAGLALASFSTPQKQANDTRRKNDLKQYAQLLKSYGANNSGFYPWRATSANASGPLCTDLGLVSTDCPVDPKTGTSPFDYKYISGLDTGGTCTIASPNGKACANVYLLYGPIEATSGSSFVVCSNGKSGVFAATTFASATCPI